MSQYAYGMPPPAPVDPTDVAWKRIAAWLIDGVIFLILINLLNYALGTAPQSTSHDFHGDSLRAENFCAAWRETHSGLCTYSNGTATTITNYAGAIWVFLALFVLFIIVQGLLGGSLGEADDGGARTARARRDGGLHVHVQNIFN